MKVVNITVMLPTEDSRKVNLKAWESRKEVIPESVDKVIIAQEFTDVDRETYKEARLIEFPKRLGFAGARNEAFKFLYNSDYDYAILTDARDTISSKSKNALLTLVRNLEKGEFTPDFVNCSRGNVVDAERIAVKKANDYNEFVTLMRTNSKTTSYLHFAIIRNFNKHYNKSFYINMEILSEINKLIGSEGRQLLEDETVIEGIRNISDAVYFCPEIAQSGGGSKSNSSTHSDFDYYMIKTRRKEHACEIANLYVKNSEICGELQREVHSIVKLRREKEFLEDISIYKPKTKNCQELELF